MTVDSVSLERTTPLPRTALRAQLAAHADILWMIALALVAGAYSLQYNILLQAIPHDTTFHIYAAQQMLEGHAIYRDVAIIKAPLADFFAVFALVVARAIHISDVMGTRLMSLCIVMASVGATYLAGRVLFKSRAVGVLAGLVMAGWNFYGLRAVTGPEPKAFVILFALLTLVCIAQQRWVWAGVGAALTTLAWQPALMLAAIALAAALFAPFLRTSVLPRSKEAVKGGVTNIARVAFGFAAPFAVVLLYLVWNDALRAAFNATIGANVSHFVNAQARTPLPQMVRDNFAEIISDGTLYCFPAHELWLIGFGTLGMVSMFAALVVRSVRANGASSRMTRALGSVRSQVVAASVTEGRPLARDDAPRLPINLEQTPLLLFGLGFVAFTLLDFDYCPDLFPLLPVVALGAGWLSMALARTVGLFAARVPCASRAQQAQTIALVAAAVILGSVYLLDAVGYRIPGVTFLDELEVVQMARPYLSPGDRVLSFGNAMVPIELHVQNASKILHIGSKSGLGVLLSEPGGVQGMIDALDRDPPKVITLARENKPEWSQPFYAWLDRHYQMVQVFPRVNMRLLIRKTE